MKTLIKTVNGFDIYFEALEEDRTLYELFPEESEERIKEIYDNNVIFCAKVTAEKCGIELGVDYLGGCVYESEEDFYIKYKDDYFADMVNEVINQAKKELPKLIDQLLK